MPFLTDEQIHKAKSVNLVDYMQAFEPDELVSVGHEFCTKTHDSLRISENGKWHWCSRNFGGTTALEYLIKVKGMHFYDAACLLLGQTISIPNEFYVPKSKKAKEKKPFALPERNADNKRAIDYLLGRNINRSIITACIREGTIYESREYHNCVFVGKDVCGVARFASQRGTFGDFKNDIESSNKEYGFCIAAIDPHDCDGIAPFKATEQVAFFESPIDALSHATLSAMIYPGEGWRDMHRIAGSGTSELALLKFLSQNEGIKRVLLCLDNDDAGNMRSAKIAQHLQELYPHIKVEREPPPTGKDFNEFLQLFAPDHRRDFDKER